MASSESLASSPEARRRMQANRRRDTAPELAVRRAAHALGLRYRVDARPLPSVNRRADMVFSRARVAVFIDGCFWHGCAQHGSSAKANAAFWEAKITRNRTRDAETNRQLGDAGWSVIRVWEHDDPIDAAMRIETVVRRKLPHPD